MGYACTTSTIKTWTEHSLPKALTALENDSNLRVLWNNTLTKMPVTHVDNELAGTLLLLFVKKLPKEDV